MAHLAPGKDKNIRWYLFAALLAVELLMSFSFLGYFHVEPISITIAYIPVLLAGALMGPVESTLLGTAFGLASMWKATASYVMAFDRLFSPFLSGSPWKSLLLSVGSRALFGLLIGLLYLPARNLRRPWLWLWLAVVSFFGRIIHSFLVYTALWLFFPETGYTPASALEDLVSPDGLAVGLISIVLVLAIWLIGHSATWQKFRLRLEAARRFQQRERYHVLSTVGIILVTLCSAVAVAIYFVHRMDTVLEEYGITLSDYVYSDLLHLQIQFLIGILSLTALVILFLLLNRWYTTYMDREAKLDPLTGIMNRGAFFFVCGKALRKYQPAGNVYRYFIMADLDSFKEINDSFGHPEGDYALTETVRLLRDIFGRDCLLGRVGGDELAILHAPVTREELEARLRRLQARLHNIRWADHSLSCSIGALPVPPQASVEDLYRDADALLYTAKSYGKDQYIIGQPVPSAR